MNITDALVYINERAQAFRSEEYQALTIGDTERGWKCHQSAIVIEQLARDLTEMQGEAA